jgi:hypothetical protein
VADGLNMTTSTFGLVVGGHCNGGKFPDGRKRRAPPSRSTLRLTFDGPPAFSPRPHRLRRHHLDRVFDVVDNAVLPLAVIGRIHYVSSRPVFKLVHQIWCGCCPDNHHPQRKSPHPSISSSDRQHPPPSETLGVVDGKPILLTSSISRGLEAPMVAFVRYGNLTIVPLNYLDWATVRKGELPDAADRRAPALPYSVCFIKCGIQPSHIAVLSRTPPVIVFFPNPFLAHRACN